MMDIRLEERTEEVFEKPPFEEFIRIWTQDEEYRLINSPANVFFLNAASAGHTTHYSTPFVNTQLLFADNLISVFDFTTSHEEVFYFYTDNIFTIDRIHAIGQPRVSIPTKDGDVFRYDIGNPTTFEPNKLYRLRFSYILNMLFLSINIREIPIVTTKLIRKRRFFKTYKSDTQTLKYALQMDKGYNVFNPLAGVGADRHIHNNDVDALANDIRNEIDVNSRERARLNRFNLEKKEGNLNIDIDGNYI